MANAHLVAVLRDALGAGAHGGWSRDREYLDSPMIVFRHGGGRLMVAVEPGWPGTRWANVRVLQWFPDLDDWVILADCKAGAWQTAVDVLAAYALVDPRHTSTHRDAVRAARPARAGRRG